MHHKVAVDTTNKNKDESLSLTNFDNFFKYYIILKSGVKNQVENREGTKKSVALVTTKKSEMQHNWCI